MKLSHKSPPNRRPGARWRGLVLALQLGAAGACVEQRPPPPGPHHYIERQDAIFAQRHLPLSENHWVRDAENLRVLHETLKSVGYDRLAAFFEFEFNEQLVAQQIYVRRSGRAILKDLNDCAKRNDCSAYAKDFFARRQSDGTLAVSQAIVREVGEILLEGRKIPVREHYVHPLLAGLLRMEFAGEAPEEDHARRQIRFLIRHGFHQSTYNLLYERHEFADLNLDRGKFASELNPAPGPLPAWLKDDTK